MRMNAKSGFFKSFTFIVLFFSLGIAIIYQQQENSHLIERDPASLPDRRSTLQNISPDDLRAELIQNVSVNTVGLNKEISFTKLASGICHNYQNIEITFVAHGVLINGEAPKFKYQGACEGFDNNSVAGVKLPGEILAQAGSDSSTWLVEKIEFQSSENRPNKIIKMTGQLQDHPIVIEK